MNSHYNQNIKNKRFCQSFLLYYIEKIGITERNDKNILLEFNPTTFFCYKSEFNGPGIILIDILN